MLIVYSPVQSFAQRILETLYPKSSKPGPLTLKSDLKVKDTSQKSQNARYMPLWLCLNYQVRICFKRRIYG